MTLTAPHPTDALAERLIRGATVCALRAVLPSTWAPSSASTAPLP